MKRVLAIVLVLVSTLAVVGTSSAQQHRVKVTVPFSFSVGDRTLPAGNYIIDSAVYAPDVLALRNWEKNIKIVTMGQPDQSSPQLNALIFDRYGNQYFLRQIRSEGASININLPSSKAEKMARAQFTIAGRPVDEPVLIALNR